MPTPSLRPPGPWSVVHVSYPSSPRAGPPEPWSSSPRAGARWPPAGRPGGALDRGPRALDRGPPAAQVVPELVPELVPAGPRPPRWSRVPAWEPRARGPWPAVRVSTNFGPRGPKNGPGASCAGFSPLLHARCRVKHFSASVKKGPPLSTNSTRVKIFKILKRNGPL
jgi:hypothetical protein